MYQEFSETISRARQDRGMTQEAFATRLGVTPQAVSRWERGNGLPDVTMLQGLCEVLHIVDEREEELTHAGGRRHTDRALR